MNVMTRSGLLFVSLVILLFLMINSKNVFSADIYTHTSDPGSIKSIVIEGKIVNGDYNKFIKQVKENKGDVLSVYIFSPGGNFSEAIKIGRAIRKLDLNTTIPSQDDDGRPACQIMKSDKFRNFLPVPNNEKNCICASSCFFIFIGGVSRGGSHVIVHRPYFDRSDFGKLSENEAKKEFEKLETIASEYMMEMGVPKHIQDEILGTPSEKAIVLDEKTVKTYFHGFIPYRHEWLQSKCGEEKDDENVRDCYIAVNEERRHTAYNKFFVK